MLNYAIIGFGGLGRIHLLNLVKIQEKRRDFQLKAICGASRDNFKKSMSTNLGTTDISMIDFSRIAFYDDYKELVKKEKIDFVIAVLPTYLHEPVAVYCLTRGIDVFCEKPMALTVEECDNIINAARTNNKKLMVGLCLRFNTAYVTLKENIDSEKYGKVTRAEFCRYSQVPKWTWNNWILDRKLSGGCALDMHIHDADLINWYFGMPTSVESIETKYKIDAESILTKYNYSDKLVTATADWSMSSSFPFTSRLTVNFTDATAVIENGRLKVYTENEGVIFKRNRKDNFMNEMEAFIKYEIDGIESHATSPEEIRDSVRLVSAEIESAKTGKKVVL